MGILHTRCLKYGLELSKICLFKTNTMYHMHTLGASKCMHVVRSVGFRSVLVLGRHTLSHHI